MLYARLGRCVRICMGSYARGPNTWSTGAGRSSDFIRTAKEVRVERVRRAHGGRTMAGKRKYIDRNGYVRYVRNNELVHRAVASRTLVGPCVETRSSTIATVTRLTTLLTTCRCFRTTVSTCVALTDDVAATTTTTSTKMTMTMTTAAVGDREWDAKEEKLLRALGVRRHDCTRRRCCRRKLGHR